MSVESELVTPVRQCREIALPEAELRALAEVEEIVVAGESALGAVGDVEDVMPRPAGPQDVVFETNVLAATSNLNRVRIQLHHGVVCERQHAAAGLHVIEQHATVAVVIDEAVRDEVTAVVCLRVDAGEVIVGDNARHIPRTIGEVETGAEVPVNLRVAQRAATPVDSRRILPRREVVRVARERAVRRVEARAVVVRVQVVELRIAAQLEARGVAECQVVMHPRHLRPRRVIVVEAASVVVSDVPAGLEARRDHRQPYIGVVKDEVIANHRVHTRVLQVDAVIAGAILVIRLIAQHGGVLCPREEAVVLITSHAATHITIEEIIANDWSQ